MKNFTIILFLVILLSSCQNNQHFEKLKLEIEVLKKHNDSLKKITEIIKNKYVFDSITIRQIPDYRNTYKLNSIFREEFVLVGYNKNQKTSVIIGDSLSFNGGIKIINGDTLKLNKGGFQNILKLKKNRNHYKGIIQAENEFGKPFLNTISSIIQVEK